MKNKKRYIVSYGREVNQQASKTGIKYVFGERTDDPDKAISEYRAHPDWYGKGIRIKDSQTGKITHCE